MISRRSSGSSRVESAVEATRYARSPTPVSLPVRLWTSDPSAPAPSISYNLHPQIPFDVSGIAVELSDCGT